MGHGKLAEQGDKDYAPSAEKHADIVDKCATLSVGLTDDKASGAELELCLMLLYYYFVREGMCRAQNSVRP